MVDPKLVLVYLAVALTLWTGSGIRRGFHRLFHPPGPEVQTSTSITPEWLALVPEPYRSSCYEVGWFVQKNTQPAAFMRMKCPAEGVRGFHRVDLHFVRLENEAEGKVRVRKIWKD
jgi:hypothetical protein